MTRKITREVRGSRALTLAPNLAPAPTLALALAPALTLTLTPTRCAPS